MTKLIAGTFVISVMLCCAATGHAEESYGAGAELLGVPVGTSTPGLPVGTATATATSTETPTATATPTETLIPTAFVDLIDGGGCAVVEPRARVGTWWLAIIPPAIAWRRYVRRRDRFRSDE